MGTQRLVLTDGSVPEVPCGEGGPERGKEKREAVLMGW